MFGTLSSNALSTEILLSMVRHFEFEHILYVQHYAVRTYVFRFDFLSSNRDLTWYFCATVQYRRRPTASARRQGAQKRYQAEHDARVAEEQMRNQMHDEAATGIEAFVERWHPETNSFHLPFGEMNITLDDVYCLTGLSIEGRPVEFVREDVAGGQHMLHSRFSELASSDDDFEAVYTASAFLVYTLGCTLFTDKTGDRITCNYLRLFEDPNQFEGYAWGVAALAFLYRQLGVALTLLKAWIYEHFPTIGRPQQNANYCAGQPYAMRWAQQAHGAVSEEVVKAFRAQLDTLRAEDVS
ncbi:hypothetical protein C2S53_014875 [Perilla frutescens var. hirtella]|uniref:Aminotransferase-like plant mobile domain-containing protein n=1 Tax=Perilla frutescens var. hirtella TaxID=608512 RepID=A0AAD4J7E7_PERFH|nr:hypothetical protein C2S53_014875 [Perilla frutescens var. hirtella]